MKETTLFPGFQPCTALQHNTHEPFFPTQNYAEKEAFLNRRKTQKQAEDNQTPKTFQNPTNASSYPQSMHILVLK